MMELLLILLIALLLWPAPLIRAAKWVIRHVFGAGSSADTSAEADADRPDDSARG